MMRRLLKYILLIPVLVSCSREDIPVNEDDAIAFSVSAPGLIVTRAEITNDVAGTIENGVLDGNIGIRLHELLIPDFLYGQFQCIRQSVFRKMVPRSACRHVEI